MAKHRPAQGGFSLVELLVALVFTMVLMSGMANVYKASLSTFHTSGESLSSVRRNRMSLDLLADDLNTACLYMMDLASPPTLSAQAPPFFILPNMAIAGAGVGDPTQSDELYFYLDQPLPFEGRLAGNALSSTAAELVEKGVAPAVLDNTYDIDFGPNGEAMAKQIKQGQVFLFKDSWEAGYVSAAPVVSGTKVQVVAGPAPNANITGQGPSGLPLKAKHLDQSGIIICLPAQMVRYRIEMLQLDPLQPNGIPCLVRDQGTYAAGGFVAQAAQQVITENITSFKVYLSTNAGTAWAGLGANYTDFAAGWDGGIRADLDTQLISSGRPGYTSTRTDEHWFRSIPTLVRVDVTTRTATQRAEYSAAGNTLAYRNLTQSLVFVPRHSGLAMN